MYIIAPYDYTGLNAIHSISTDCQCYRLTIVNDNVVETNETFLVSLSKDSPSSSVTILTPTLTVVILDDDGKIKK